MNHENFDKIFIALKFRLQGMGFYKALEALEKAKEIHKHYRKDGKTKEFQHQVEIALFALTLKNVENLEDVIICSLLHDTMEDYSDAMSEEYIKEKFGQHNLTTLKFLNKKLWRNYEEYFKNLANDMVGSLVKLIDRINNAQSMERGNFTLEKQMNYCNEIKVYFLPMAKQARKNFPKQMDAYYNIETVLKSQVELLEISFKYRRELKTEVVKDVKQKMKVK